MNNLKSKIQITIYDENLNIIYNTDFIVRGIREMGDVFDIIRTDYLDIVDEQDKKWTTEYRKRNRKDPDHPSYKWWDNLPGDDDEKRR